VRRARKDVDPLDLTQLRPQTPPGTRAAELDSATERAEEGLLRVVVGGLEHKQVISATDNGEDDRSNAHPAGYPPAPARRS
jgi:hypothetical protein